MFENKFKVMYRNRKCSLLCSATCFSLRNATKRCRIHTQHRTFIAMCCARHALPHGLNMLNMRQWRHSIARSLLIESSECACVPRWLIKSTSVQQNLRKTQCGERIQWTFVTLLAYLGYVSLVRCITFTERCAPNHSANWQPTSALVRWRLWCPEGLKWPEQ